MPHYKKLLPIILACMLLLQGCFFSGPQNPMAYYDTPEDAAKALGIATKLPKTPENTEASVSTYLGEVLQITYYTIDPNIEQEWERQSALEFAVAQAGENSRLDETDLIAYEGLDIAVKERAENGITAVRWIEDGLVYFLSYEKPVAEQQIFDVIASMR